MHPLPNLEHPHPYFRAVQGTQFIFVSGSGVKPSPCLKKKKSILVVGNRTKDCTT